jgi:4'-phosphopantetheinyl transferase
MLHRPSHTLDANQVHVWHLLTESLSESPLLGAVQAWLAPEEQIRLERAGKHVDRVLYAMSRVVMRTVLASYLNCHGREVRFSVNSFGKPILDGINGCPPLHFNLSHSRGAIALAVCRDREVGVDVEERQRRVEHLALAERFFAAAEARHLQQLDEEQRGNAFFAIWTLKEAYVKGIGRGLTFPLDAFCFDLHADRLIGFRPLADFVAPDWHFHQFDLGARHCGAVAVQTPAGHRASIVMRDWNSAFLPAR